MSQTESPMNVEIIKEDEAFLSKKNIFYKLPVASGSIGALSLILAFVIGLSQPKDFFFSFHISWLFFVSIAIGALGFVLIQFATRAGWSVGIRRAAEHLMKTLPFLFLFFPVLYFGSHDVFHHWMSDHAHHDPIIVSKSWFLNDMFFYGRALFYFIVWMIVAWIFSRLSLAQDKTGDHKITYKLQNLSYPALIFVTFTVTFAAFDWLMSLDPHWFSTIFGIYFTASCILAVYASLSIIAYLLRNEAAYKKAVNVEHMNDLGKLVFGHTCFWAYTAFCQYFLIWYANLPEETAWYQKRLQHGWEYVSLAIVVGHFIVPFVFLMRRKIKRNPKLLMMASVWLLVMHYLDFYWLVVPTMSEAPHFSVLLVLTLVGIGGLFVSFFSSFLKNDPIVPIKDPRLPETIQFENN